MAVLFANIFMPKTATTLIQQSDIKPKEWTRYIDDFYLWDSDKKLEKDLKKNLYWTLKLVLTTNQLKPFNIHISTHAFHQQTQR